MLTYYQKHHFIQNNGKQSCTNVDILLNLLTQKGIILDGQKQECFNELILYPYDFFCAKDCSTGLKQVTQRTVCIHDYAATWKDNRKKTYHFHQNFYLRLNIGYTTILFDLLPKSKMESLYLFS